MIWPIQLTGSFMSNLLAFMVAFGFGFVLERSGFGDARRLAAQFYFHEQRVFKVMFTAVITAMILLFWSSALGLLDFEKLYVNPTHLWPALVGGLVLGAGFIIGGYCPGTSLVSAATGKIDGMFFVGGVSFGVVVFAETYDWVRAFFESAGDMGRLQLPGLLGVDTGVVVFVAVAGAIGLFWGAGHLEKMYKDRQPAGYDS